MESNEIIIEVNTKPYSDFKLYQRKKFTFTPGITSLVGCNGSGKSTLIDHYLIPYLKDNGIALINWNDRHQGGSMLMDKFLNFSGDMEGLAYMTLSSEGERISYGLGSILGDIGKGIRQNKDKQFVVTLDAIDSGMSVDEIIQIRELFLDVIIPDAQHNNCTLYIVIAANNFEWCNDERICNIDITNAKRTRFSSYENYKSFILNSRKIKDKLRE